MPDVGDKYHVFIDGQGYVLASSPRKRGKYLYEKRRAPTFVNKFGSGDSSYRDASFWQFWAQTNWRNGSQQLKFNDFGKFWKSENINTHDLERIRLSNRLTSIGQTAAGTTNRALISWRSSQSWWNNNYLYRQRLTVTMPSAAVKKGHPIKISIDTAALQTDGKVRSDRNDWRVIFWNGTGWEEVTRDYVDTTATFFGLKKDMAANESDENYFVYYGNSGESDDPQPTDDEDFLEIYGMYRNHTTDSNTPDGNTIAHHMFREATGTTLNDHKNSNNGTTTNVTWATAGKYGRFGSFNGSSSSVDLGTTSAFNLGSFTIEGWVYRSATGDRVFFQKDTSTNNGTANYSAGQRDALLKTRINGGSTYDGGTIPLNTWTHIAVTHDGTNARLYVNGSLVKTQAVGGPSSSTGVATYGKAGNSSTEWFNGGLQHFRISNTARTSFPYVLASEPTVTAGGEETEQPPSSSFELYAGQNNGKIYKWDGVGTFDEVFDCRQLVWYDDTTLVDADRPVGDDGGTEYAQAQSFELDSNQTVKSLGLWLKKAAGTPGDITVRIETNSTSVPSGTLVDSNAETTIPAFAATDYAWVEAVFSNTFVLNAATKYWIVVKTAAAANDNHYELGTDESSPGYTDGNMADSSNGGTSWSAQTGREAMFRIFGPATQPNCVTITRLGGDQKMVWGTGDPKSTTNGEGRLYSYDGTSWVLEHTFNADSCVLSVEEYRDELRAGLGPRARIYKSADLDTWTEEHDIRQPQNPGYIWSLKEYNGLLYAAGGGPEFLPDQHYNGFVYYFDTTEWNNLYPFDFTTIRSLQFYDAFLFMGTYNGQLFVFDTATLTPIFSWNQLYEYQVQVAAMGYYDDKLHIALMPQEGTTEENVGVWLYDRHGLTKAFHNDDYEGYTAFAVVNNELIVGTASDGHICRINKNSYASQGELQTSYFDANLPSIDKLYHKYVVRHDPLPADTSVRISYRFNEEEAWTVLGTSDTPDSEFAEFDFPAETYNKKITFLVELLTNNIALTPTVTETVLQYALYPQRKWIWTLRILAKTRLTLLDKTRETKTPQELRDEVEALLESPRLVTFIDIDNVSHSVLPTDVDQASWVVHQAGHNEDEIAITLLES